jgi:hypothetical protein
MNYFLYFKKNNLGGVFMKNIAIEKGLSDVESFLSNAGYQVKEFERNSIEKASFYNSFDAVVITGQSMNLMGYEDTTTKVPEIYADGLTPEQVEKQIEIKTKNK